ncbi:MAG: thiamine pyrophosphate-dependent enzyme, partial [Pseudomonadales bacterium]|nr:thiamine pyrophosphate-dependent enzyme [Pseudomonadales bacterium]
VAGSGATTLPARKWIQESDVLFAVGSSLTLTPYSHPNPDVKIIIHKTQSREDINKDYSVEIGLPGDAQLTLQSMIELVKSKDQPPADVAQGILDLKEEWMKDWTPLLNSDEIPLNIYRVIGDIIKTLDLENSIVTHDAGGPRDSILPFYPATVPNSYVGWGKTTHLGFGIPLMIGAKLANPDKFCLNFMGDGAFGMSGLDIETAVREKAPITTIVLNNGGMATYPGGMPTARERYGTTEMTGDYAKIAEGLGAVGIVVIQPTEMVPALRRAQQLNAEGQTVLIDVHSNMEARRSRP